MTTPGVAEAVELLQDGRVVGLPTDTVYGLAAIPTDRQAVERLFELKDRPSDQPVALLVASVVQAGSLVTFTPTAHVLAAEHWPGPLTLVLDPVRPLPAWVGDPERRTVGVRMPRLALTLDVLAKAGPLAVTSANLSGEIPVLDDVVAREVFGDGVALYLPGRCPGGTASTVVDATVDPPVVVRPGPISLG